MHPSALRASAWLLIAVLQVACTVATDDVDATPPDASVPGDAALDAAHADAAPEDAGAPPRDGGQVPAPLDAAADATLSDAQPAQDAESSDGGGALDGGQDASPGDSGGAPPDCGTSADAGANSCGSICWDGFPRGEMTAKLRHIANVKPSPEGVAVCPDGQVFVAIDGAGSLARVPLDGQPLETWASLGDRRPAGLTCDDRGRLFAAMFSTQRGQTLPIEILMVSGKNAAPLGLPQPINGEPLQGLNGIVAAPGRGVYATDTLSGRIVLARETASGTFETRVVASDILLPNGLAYDASTSKLYAVSSGAWDVLSFDVAADGTLGKATPVTVNGFILTLDGVAVDETGTVYIADYFGGAVVRARDGQAIAQLTNPASLAFRGGTLLITDYRVLDQDAEGGLYAVELGICGAPLAPGP